MTTMMSSILIEKNREIVNLDYRSADVKNQELFHKGNVKATSMYIYPNQAEDAAKIINTFYNDKHIRVVSVFKKTKVGMDGLMIEVAKNFAIHPDDNFVIHRENVIFATGMSNIMWENDMKDKIPACFKENIFHHGKLQNLKDKLKNLRNGLIIIDEIDTGDKQDQKLDRLLKDSGLLDINIMMQRNIRFIFGSATPVRELEKLFEWGDKHVSFRMSIPDNYIGHKEFLERDILKESYVITADTAEKWIQEDIKDMYQNEFRVHLIRTDNKKVSFIHDACIKQKIKFANHTSEDRISNEDLDKMFANLDNHVVIAVKGLLRRANYIPNQWKIKIGAVHEYYSKKPDVAVQIQGLVGRMTGYWKHIIESGHRTGPYRCSLQSIQQYEVFYSDPTNAINVLKQKVFMDPKNIKNLVPIRTKDNNKRVPVIVENIEKTSNIFIPGILNVQEKVDMILEILNKQELNKLAAFIKNPNVLRGQITMPMTDNSYKKHIEDVVKAYMNNVPFCIDNTHKNNNNWQCFIDNRQYRLCFVVWVVDESLY